MHWHWHQTTQRDLQQVTMSWNDHEHLSVHDVLCLFISQTIYTILSVDYIKPVLMRDIS